MSTSLRAPWTPGTPGAVAVDKPAGWTSHDVVARARRLLGERRVGHAGTLDPDATGVLVLGIGSATRLLRFAGDLVKSYAGEVVLGIETTTLDASGEVTAEHDMSGVTLDDVAKAAGTLTGRIAQVPPMVSALHSGGRRLHELAREGITVERQPRDVEVFRFEVSPGSSPGCFAITVDCSSGTYVRSLAADLGTALGGGAHLRSLRRTAVGELGRERLVPLASLTAEHVGPPELLVAHLARVVVDGTVALAVGHGKVLERVELGVAEGGEAGRATPGPWAVFSEAGSLLAVYEMRDSRRVKPLLVLAAGQ
jgi:tRNA pseudouridine55 synthase